MELSNFPIKLRGGATVQLDDIHPTSMKNLITATLKHLNNEVASKVQGRIERDARSGIVRDTKESKDKGLTPDKGEVKVAKLEAFRDKFGSAYDTFIAEEEAAAVKTLIDGTFRAPREASSERGYTRLQAKMRVPAKIYAKQKLGKDAMPKLDEPLRFTRLPGVDGPWEGTFSEFVDWLCENAPDAPTWKADAERAIKLEDDAAAAAKSDGFDMEVATIATPEGEANDEAA